MGYIWLKLWDIFGKILDILRKNYVIYLQKQWDIFQRTMGYIGQNNGIYWAKTIGDISRYSWQKLWDILGKNYGISYGIYWLKIIGYICQTSGIYWSIGYIKLKLRED